MVKRRILVIGSFLMMVFSSSAIAAEHVRQEYLERQTFFNNVSDYMATIGKTDEEEQKIRRKRRAQRRRVRLEAENVRVQQQNRRAYEERLGR